MTRIAIIRFSALGDVAMLVPVIKAAALQNPNVQFTIISRLQTEPLWSCMPANVLFRGADLKGVHHGTKGLRKLLDEIDYKRFDAVADMHSVLRSWYMDWRWELAGAKVVRIDKGRIEKRWLTSRFNHHKTKLKTTIERYADVLRRLGVDAECAGSIISGEGKSGIGIAPFAAHPGKLYPLDRMERVVARLAENEQVMLFGGGEREVRILEGWADKYNNVTCVAGRHSLGEELQIIRGLRLMIAMDSANMHLASLVCTRVVSVWGATDPKAGFLGYGQLADDCIQKPMKCRPCSVYGNKKCRYGNYACLAIDPEIIVEQATKTC